LLLATARAATERMGAEAVRRAEFTAAEWQLLDVAFIAGTNGAGRLYTPGLRVCGL
jgi:hypothetical protein